MRTHLFLMAIASLALTGGCVGDIGSTTGDDDGSDMPPEPVTCQATRSYAGFAGTPLETDRPTIEPGSDRMRLKPYAALAAEYKAALGLTAFDTAAYANTFGKPPARWFTEPQASANTLYAAFALAYGACTQATASDVAFATAPTTTGADVLCGNFIRGAWHREPAAAETAACVDYSVNKTKASDAPRVRWAYTCAAVLSASGFLAY
jgi:hypothetical protein